jgi:hypothetical protein
VLCILHEALIKLDILGSSVSIKTGYSWDILALGPTLPPIQWVTWGCSPEVKRPGREADSSIEFRDREW